MRKILLFILSVYKNLLSPFIHRFFGLQGLVCRHSPTCSEYTYRMIQTKGVLKGGFLGIQRLLSCHPYKKSVKFNLGS